MKGIIFYYSNRENAIDKFNDVIKNYKRLQIEANVVVNLVDAIAVFENGDVWEVCPVSGRARGKGCNVALIERCTPEEDVHKIIFPTIKFLPYRAYNYYGSSSIES